MKHFFRFLPFLFLAQSALGQSYSFLSYSTSEGLPQSQVTSINQDENGYLWVGTLSGLAKFNGKRFISYSTENGLANNRVHSLSLINKQLWVGHEGGISVMVNGKARSWQLFGEDRSVIVMDIVYFKHCIVAATNGGGLYFIKDNQIRKFSFSNPNANRCRDLLIVNNKLYVATKGGVYNTADLAHFSHSKEYGERSVSGFAQSEKKLIVSTYTEGLFSAGGNLTRKDSIPIQAKEYNIKRSYIDTRGQIWLSSIFGVIRIGRDGRQLLLNQSNGLPIASVNCIFEDREGIIWMGTEGKGLLRFTGEDFVYYNSKNGFPSDQILSVAKSPGGNYLFGSYDQGLFTWDGTKAAYIDVKGKNIWSLAYDAYSNLWCGNDLGLSARFRNGELKLFSTGEEVSRITVIRRFPNGDLIAGGSGGIGWIRKEQFTPLKLNTDFGKTLGTVRDFAFFNGKIVCAADKGLFEINAANGTCKRIRYFSSGVTSLFIDDNNRLWIGTENGLFIYDGLKFDSLKIGSSNGTRFINFQQKVGSYMYVGTNNGLYVFDCEEDKPFIAKHYGINDGLINLESNINSALYDGRFLWFGTAEGLIRFDVNQEQKLNSKRPLPLVNITGILLNYQPFDYAPYTTKLDGKGLPTDLNLPYNKNNISIDLDGMLLADPNGLRYQFWLEGQDEDWSPLLTNPSIVLSNISSGDYVLHIRTVDEMGAYSRELLLPVHITPPFWGTWWFYTIIAILMVLATRSFFLSRIRQERERNYKENLENKSRLLALEQQSLNASMNRHFIFNSLNSIQYFINTQDRLSANRYLTNFAKLIRKNLDSAAEGDNMVTLQQELERLELYLSLEAMRFKDRFDYRIETGDIDVEQVLVPAMLLQPFVENSIIHGILPDETKKGRIDILLKTVDHLIEITISDNGIGIDFSMKQKNQFHGDHKSQGMEITSKRIDLIRKMWKKDYELHGPFQVYNSDHSIKGTSVLIKIPIDNLEING